MAVDSIARGMVAEATEQLNNKIDEVEKNKSYVFDNYESMINDFNSASKTKYKIGNNIYIKTEKVPDTWVSGIGSTKIEYTYTSDAAVVADLQNGNFQVGWYQFAILETEEFWDLKVDKVVNATVGNLASLTEDGDIEDSGKSAENVYEKPIDGIPATDMTEEVQVSLQKANTAIQDISGKVDKVPGKGLSTNDFTTEDKNKLDGIEAGAEVNDVTSVAGRTGTVILTKNDVGLSNVDNTSDANKPISTATQAALNSKANASNVSAIEEKIPNQASAQNQLADKEFVNSSVATNTANYRSNNGEPFTSVAQLEAYSGPVTNNDYAFVTGTDSEGNTYYDRYKATVVQSTVSWAKEYRLNNSSFTADQWAAISSGITSLLVDQIGANTEAIAEKQNILTFDNTPTQNSNNPVKSGGVYNAMNGKLDFKNSVLIPGTIDGQIAMFANGRLYSWDEQEESWDEIPGQFQNAEETAYVDTLSLFHSASNVQYAIDELAGATMPVVITTTAAEAEVVTSNNQDFRLGVVSTSIEVTMPGTITGEYCSCIRFTTPPTIPTNYSSFPNSVYYIGDDTITGIFTPIANKRYTMLFDYDGDAVVCYICGRVVNAL